MGRKQFQLLSFALLVEHLHAFQPPCLRGSVQLPQVAQRPLARSVNRSHRLYQRPVDVILTVFRAVVRSQEHLAPIMSSHPSLFKMVGLHYTPFSPAPIANTILPSHQTSKLREFDASMTNLG